MNCFVRPNKAKKLTDTQKGRVISLRKDGHHTLADIAHLTDTSIQTVHKWIQKYEQDGNVERKLVPGNQESQQLNKILN